MLWLLICPSALSFSLLNKMVLYWHLIRAVAGLWPLLRWTCPLGTQTNVQLPNEPLRRTQRNRAFWHPPPSDSRSLLTLTNAHTHTHTDSPGQGTARFKTRRSKEITLFGGEPGEKGEAGAKKKKKKGGCVDVAPPLGSDRQPVTQLRDKASQRGDLTRSRHGNRLFRFPPDSSLISCPSSPPCLRVLCLRRALHPVHQSAKRFTSSKIPLPKLTGKFS